jgi:hypothetical protein
MFADYYVELYVRKTIDFLIKFSFPTDKKYLHALFCTDEMTLNVFIPHTPLPCINIGSIMDVYSLLYTLYIPCICLQPFGVKLSIE